MLYSRDLPGVLEPAAAAARAALAEDGGALPLVSEVLTPTPAPTSVSSNVELESFMMTMAPLGLPVPPSTPVHYHRHFTC